MLHKIEPDGTISRHCYNPQCAYHNCQGWDREIPCPHHGAGQRNQPAGKTITGHIRDEEIQWTSPTMIALPTCPGCGSRAFALVHDDNMLTPPIITRDQQSGKILQVAPQPGHEHHANLWIVRADNVRKQQPHPTLAHLTPAQIQQMQADIRNKAPDAPVDWMMTETIEQNIHDVYLHPAVARHRELAKQLAAIGKVPPGKE